MSKEEKDCFGEWKEECRTVVPEDLDCPLASECKKKYKEKREEFL